MTIHDACQNRIPRKYCRFWQKEKPMCPNEHMDSYLDVVEETQSLVRFSAISRDAELAHFLVEVAAFEPKLLRSTGHFTVACRQSLLDDLFLKGFEKRVQTTRGGYALSHGNHVFFRPW